jgi:hypothetical protein
MSITKETPNVIHLAGHGPEVGDVPAGEAITPGHLIERYDAGSGVSKFRKHTATSLAGNIYAKDAQMLNKGVDDAYASGDLVFAVVANPGDTIWALIASGQNIATGGDLESAGNGTLKAYSAGVKIATAIESVNAVVTPTRLRVEVR